MQVRFKKHPLIPDLEVASDGSCVKYKGRVKEVKVVYKRNIKVPEFKVSVMNKCLYMHKLVCEAWHGARPDFDYRVGRKKDPISIHYTNLYWQKVGGKDLRYFRGPSSRISNRKVKNLLKKLEGGARMCDLVAQYKISDTAIYKLKAIYLKKAE